MNESTCDASVCVRLSVCVCVRFPSVADVELPLGEVTNESTGDARDDLKIASDEHLRRRSDGLECDPAQKEGNVKRHTHTRTHAHTHKNTDTDTDGRTHTHIHPHERARHTLIQP